MKNNKKLNEGCLKIFQLLKLLYEDKADYDNVVEIFKDKIEEQTTNNIQVNLNKYINTLKIFGIKIKKEKQKYKLLSSLYSMKFSIEDLKSISILVSSLQKFPEVELTEDIKEFVSSLELRMDNEDKNILNCLNKIFGEDFSFYYADVREQIEQCEQVCKENFVINLTYRKKNKDITCKCSPKEVLYDSKTAYLKVYDSVIKRNLEIPITSILSITKLPQIANPIEMNTTVVYKLKNRLAKTYKVKENEYTDGRDEYGNLIVINKNEVAENLIRRLLRYSYDCEVISPKHFRDEMQRAINEIINQYEE
ncbi:hypothetical protein IKL64_04205 [bacterium]|nr:hypothetical protein [bacterium]